MTAHTTHESTLNAAGPAKRRGFGLDFLLLVFFYRLLLADIYSVKIIKKIYKKKVARVFLGAKSEENLELAWYLRAKGTIRILIEVTRSRVLR